VDEAFFVADSCGVYGGSRGRVCRAGESRD
jgi:hypothetical protein